MKKYFSFLLLLALSYISVSQVEIDSATVKLLQGYEFGGVYRSSLTFNVGGVTGIAGVTYDALIGEKLGFEIGGGYLGAGFGLTYYPFGVKREKKKFHIAYKSSLTNMPWRPTLIQHSLSFGGTWFTINKFNIATDIGAAYGHNTTSLAYVKPSAITNFPVYLVFTFKVAYRFSFKLMKRRRELNKRE